VRTYSLRCKRAAPTHTCQQPIRQYALPISAISAARPPRPVWLEEECYDWHKCVRYYKRTLWHSLTTACIATDANSQSVNRLYLHGTSLTSINDSSKSTSLTVRRSACSRLSIPFVPSYMLCNSRTRSRVLALGNARGAAARLPKSWNRVVSHSMEARH
jgi:hypothetical protein